MVVLEVVVAVTVPLLLPEAGETVHHEASLLTFQTVLDVILNDFCSPAFMKLSEDGSTERLKVGVPYSTIFPKFPQTG